MFNVYVLKSVKSNKRYIGYTSKNVHERLMEHNSGVNQWSRAHKPFTLLYQEAYQTKKEAIIREHFLKSGQGRKWLDDNIPG